MTVLGITPFPPLNGGERTFIDIPNMFKSFDITYPNAKTKQNEKITMLKYWNGLTDNQCEWNVIDRISNIGEGIKMCPPVPQLMMHTSGSLSVAKQQLDKDVYSEWIRLNRPHISENRIYTELFRILQNEDGSLMQGFSPSSYLGLLTDGLNVSFEDINHDISKQWKAVAILKGINVEFVKNSTDCSNVVNEIQKNITTANYDVEKIIPKKTKKKSGKIKYLRSTTTFIFEYFKIQNKDYDVMCTCLTDDQIRNAFIIAYIKSFGSEVDFFCVFPALRTVMQIEVKDTVSNDPKHVKNFRSNACKQLHKMQRWLFKAHCDIFQEWKYVGAIAFPSIERTSFPFSLFEEEKSPFTITKNDIDSNWWRNVKQALKEPQFNENLKDTEAWYQSYNTFMLRVIGFSKFGHDMRNSLMEGTRRVQNALQGPNKNHVTSGARDNDEWASSTNHKAIDKIHFGKDVIENERNCLSAILWFKHQAAILHNDPLRMLFSTDFGTGNKNYLIVLYSLYSVLHTIITIIYSSLDEIVR